MRQKPLILISPDCSRKETDSAGLALHLSGDYERALLDAGALPWAVMSLRSPSEITECVRCCDGVMLAGGDDLEPRLYAEEPARRLRRTCVLTPDGGARDWRELVLIREVFRQRKPLLAICRGHQLLNVALGGDLYIDLELQRGDAMRHQQPERRLTKVHDVRLTPGGLLAKITGRQVLGVNSTHHQAVKQPSDILTVSAASADGVVEGMELHPAAAHLLPFLLSVQFHPESLAGSHPEHHAIFTAFARACVTRQQK